MLRGTVDHLKSFHNLLITGFSGNRSTRTTTMISNGCCPTPPPLWNQGSRIGPMSTEVTKWLQYKHRRTGRDTTKYVLCFVSLLFRILFYLRFASLSLDFFFLHTVCGFILFLYIILAIYYGLILSCAFCIDRAGLNIAQCILICF